MDYTSWGSRCCFLPNGPQSRDEIKIKGLDKRAPWCISLSLVAPERHGMRNIRRVRILYRRSAAFRCVPTRQGRREALCSLIDLGFCFVKNGGGQTRPNRDVARCLYTTGFWRSGENKLLPNRDIVLHYNLIVAAREKICPNPKRSPI